MSATALATVTTGLADELRALYDEARAAMGDADLEHIRTVTAYGQAIDARRLELLRTGGPGAAGRAAVLEMLYRLLQFSELGHNILHGSYDDLPGNGEYHSDRYHWDFNVDAAQWKVMHHEGHHPYTNIVGKDHDLGYSVLRGQAAQDWFGHHAVQVALLGAVFPFLTQLAPFLVANITREVDGSRFWSRDTLRGPLRIALADTKRRLISEPLSTGRRFLPAMVANHVGGVAGYAAVLFLVAIEHHAGEMEVFADPGPEETHDEYYRRQIRSTRNFLRSPQLDSVLQRILDEEVPFDNRPDFRIFYGGLDTHVEHHLFPDLPPNRQREVAPRVKEIVTRYGLPYHETPLGETAALLLKTLTGLSIPVGEREAGHPLMLLKRPAGLARRLTSGVRYRRLPDAPYLDKPRWYNVPVRVVATERLAGGQARLIRLEKPRGWDDVCWDPGAFVSVQVPEGEQTLIRQYSLVHDSDGSDTMDICVKRVSGGRVSNRLNDDVRVGELHHPAEPPGVDRRSRQPRHPGPGAVRRRGCGHHADHQPPAATRPLRCAPGRRAALLQPRQQDSLRTGDRRNRCAAGDQRPCLHRAAAVPGDDRDSGAGCRRSGDVRLRARGAGRCPARMPHWTRAGPGASAHRILRPP